MSPAQFFLTRFLPISLGATLCWIILMRRYNILCAIQVIAGALVDVFCQLLIDLGNLFKWIARPFRRRRRKAREIALDEFERQLS